MCACTSLEAGLMWFGELWWWFGVVWWRFGSGLGWFGGGFGWFGDGLGWFGVFQWTAMYIPRHFSSPKNSRII